MAREAGLSNHQGGVVKPDERANLRAELDGLVAHLYGLTEEEFAYILTTFPLVDESVKEAALEAYRKLTPKTEDEEVAGLISGGESDVLELKSSARWDMNLNKANKALERVIVKTSAGFLNSEIGGTLLIGVDAEGRVYGLTHDYKTLGKKKNRDGYENWLTTLLLDNFGKDLSPLIRISFHSIDNEEVCRVKLNPAPRPVFVKDGNAEHLYVRMGNSTRQLTTKEAIDYRDHRWGRANEIKPC